MALQKWLARKSPTIVCLKSNDTPQEASCIKQFASFLFGREFVILNLFQDPRRGFRLGGRNDNDTQYNNTTIA